MLHWYFNDEKCILTLAEYKIKKRLFKKNIDYRECFTYKIIAPVYNFNRDHKKFNKFCYLDMASLLGLSLAKIMLF